MHPPRNSPAPRSRPAVGWFETWPLRPTAASTWLAAAWTKSPSWTPILNNPGKKIVGTAWHVSAYAQRFLLQLAQQFTPDFLTPASPFDSVNKRVSRSLRFLFSLRPRINDSTD